MIKLKDDTVNTSELDPRLWVAYGVALAVYEHFGNQDNCVITSANDGRHMKNSLHYANRAIDLRIWGFDEYQCGAASVMLGSHLSLEYDVVLEKDHIHVEYDPK